MDYDEVGGIPADLMQRLGLVPPPVIREADLCASHRTLTVFLAIDGLMG